MTQSAGITLEDINRNLPEEVSNVLAAVEGGHRAGELRAGPGRAGVVIVFDLDSVEEARRYTDDFPL